MRTKARKTSGVTHDLAEACEAMLCWLLNAEAELGGPLPVKYAAMIQKPVVTEKARAALVKAGRYAKVEALLVRYPAVAR
jgi:hypothetical protein